MSGKPNIALSVLDSIGVHPIYQRHPSATMYAICQRTKRKLDASATPSGWRNDTPTIANC